MFVVAPTDSTPGNVCSRADQFVVKSNLLLWFTILQTGQCEIESQHLVPLKAGIDSQQLHETLQHQSTADE